MSKHPKGYSRLGLTATRAREALADGKWRSLSSLVGELGREITPEGALRRAEMLRQPNIGLAGARRLAVKVTLDLLARDRLSGSDRHLTKACLERKVMKGEYYYRLVRRPKGK